MSGMLALFEKERSTRVHLLALTLCILVAYGLSLTAGVFGDDLILIKKARDSSWSFGDLSRSFDLGARDITDGWLPSGIEDFRLYFFRPFCVAIFKLDDAVWGSWWPGYHFTNLIIQLGVVFLIYFWARDFGLEKRYRFLAALLFIFYTPNEMSVNWISGRTELLSALFIIASVFSLGRFHTSRKPYLYALSFLAFVLAMGTKENVVMLPFLHVLAASSLYRAGPGARQEIKDRAYAIAPFFALLPLYFVVRYWSLEGFPVPTSGHYYHRPGDPNFWAFLFTKLSHTVVALVFQVPALTVPIFFERSMGALAILTALAVVTAIPLVLWLKPPLRYFLLGWVALALAPTLPVALNPVYYYLSSPALVLLYVFLYRSFSSSPTLWRGRAARGLLFSALVMGFVLTAGSGLVLSANAQPTRDVARDIRGILDTRREAETVYVLDAAPNMQYLVPEIRLASPEYDDTRFVFLNMSSDFLFGVASGIRQIDASSFEARSLRGTYFTTAFANAILNTAIIEFYPGLSVSGDGYRIEVTAVEGSYESRDEPEMLQRIRKALNYPEENQLGVKGLRYEFDIPLWTKSHVFIQVDGRHAREVEFEPLTTARPHG